MSSQGIIKKIEQSAAEEKRRLLEEAEKEAEEIRRRTEEELENIKAEHNQALERMLEENRRKVASNAALEARMSVEKRKRAVLDRVFSEAERGIADLPEAEYKKFAAELAARIEKGAKGELVAPESRLAAARSALKARGVSVTGSRSGDFSAGFIFIADDCEYDFSLPRLLRAVRNASEPRIVKILFSE